MAPEFRVFHLYLSFPNQSTPLFRWCGEVEHPLTSCQKKRTSSITVLVVKARQKSRESRREIHSGHTEGGSY